MTEESMNYHPQHPLPTEIQQMDHEDTICKYCGISYLIHNEIKRIQKLLEDCEKEVERLKHFDLREESLKEEINVCKKQEIKLKDQLQFERHRFDENEVLLEEKSQVISKLKMDVKSLEKNCEEYQTKFKNMKRQFTLVQENVGNFNKVFKEIKGNVKQFQETIILNMGKTVKNKISEKIVSLCDENSSLQKKIFVLQETNEQQIQAHAVSIKELKHEKRKNLSNELSEKDNKHQIQLKEYQERLEKKCEEFSKMLLERDVLNKKISNLEGEQNEKEMETKITMDSFKSQILHLNETISSLNTITKNDETSLKSLLKKQEDTIRCLNQEREKTIEAHQHRIQELRESFAEKLLVINGFPDKLQKELQMAKQSMKEMHNKQIEEINSKHMLKFKELEKNWTEKLRKMKTGFDLKESKLKTKLNVNQNEYESSIRKMKLRFEGEFKQLHSINDNLKSKDCEELCEMQALVDRLKDEVVSLSKKKDEENLQRQRRRSSAETIMVVEQQKRLNDLQHRLMESEGIIQWKSEQIESLRECIHRECEERYVLTEALSNARTELLSLQRFKKPLVQNQNNKTAHRRSSLVPTPPLQERQNSSASLTTPTKMGMSQSEESWSRWKNKKSKAARTVSSTTNTSDSSKPASTHASFKHKLNMSLKNS